MKKYIKNIGIVMTTIIAVSVLYFGLVMNVFSSESGGLGLTSEEWAVHNARKGSAVKGDFNHNGIPDNQEGSSGKVSSSPSNPAASTSKPATKKKEYSHDYDSITDLAKEAFIYFTQDGTPDSVYLNIKATSSENTINGKELNATTAGNEDGRISFVDDDKNVQYEYIFSGWKSDANYHIDLTALFDKYDTNDFEEAYTLRFSDGGTIPEGNDLTFRVQTGIKDTELYIYVKGESDEDTEEHTESGATYEKIHTGLTDEDGFLELHPTELSEYIVSLGEPIMVKEEEPEPEVVEEPEPEPEVVAEPEKPAPAPITEPAESESKKFPVLPVAIGIAVFLIALCVGIIIKKKK